MSSEHRPNRMSDNQRRFFCRMVFLFVCFLPTVVSIYFIAHQADNHDWELFIQSELPIKVDIDSVETPLPNRVILRGLTVVPSEASLIPELNGFDVEEVIVDYGFTENELTFLHPVEIEINSFASMLRRLMVELDDTAWNLNPWKLSFQKVSLVDTESNSTFFLLKPLSVTLHRGPSNHGSASSLKAELVADAGLSDKQPFKITFEKSDKLCQFIVNTGNHPLPSSLLKRFVSDDLGIGDSSNFVGEIKVAFETGNPDRTNDVHSSGTFVGDVNNVHLDEIRADDYRLTGICDIKNLFCKFEDGRIDSAHLQITSSNPVTVDRRFLNRVTNLGVSFDQTDKGSDQLSIAKVDFGVDIHNGHMFLAGKKQQVTIEGRITEADCIAFKTIDGQLRPLAICNSRDPIPLVAAAQFLAGDRLSNQTIELLDRFHIQ